MAPSVGKPPAPTQKPKCLSFPEKPYQLDAEGRKNKPACIIKPEGDTGMQHTTPVKPSQTHEKHASLSDGFLAIA